MFVKKFEEADIARGWETPLVSSSKKLQVPVLKQVPKVTIEINGDAILILGFIKGKMKYRVSELNQCEGSIQHQPL